LSDLASLIDLLIEYMGCETESFPLV